MKFAAQMSLVRKRKEVKRESRAGAKRAVTALLCLQLQTARFFLMLSKRRRNPDLSGRECGAALHISKGDSALFHRPKLDASAARYRGRRTVDDHPPHYRPDHNFTSGSGSFPRTIKMETLKGLRRG